jgi:hypothetical protein
MHYPTHTPRHYEEAIAAAGTNKGVISDLGLNLQLLDFQVRARGVRVRA